ncbi:ABC transporter permease [Pontibacter pamirensis]|uniref:ABC transporter permease n=1 Tax=Pontibacter pamirensis TaxID=2562824 RepID=UPI0013897353|nr:ABC transporter permease [Pontibacter pamirensis]
MPTNKSTWDWEIGTETSYLGASPQEFWSYRHLLASLVKRDFLLKYQQTVLGPFWILFPPLMTLVTYLLVFDKIVGVSTGELPPVLFYFSGIVLWNFFSSGFAGTATTFRDNSQIFSKVYFPRLVMPLSVMSRNFFDFLIQLALLLLMMAFYWLFLDWSVSFDLGLLWFPISVLTVGGIALGMGLVFSVLTAKYRDMAYLISLGVRLLMFITPVIYPLEAVPEDVRWLAVLNPLTPLFEVFRLSLLGEGTVSPYLLGYSVLFMVVLMVVSLLLFNKQGDKLIDIL